MIVLAPNNYNGAELLVPSASTKWNIEGGLSDTAYSNVLLDSVYISDSESIDVRKCFDDATHIFAFGRNTERCVISVRLIVLLGIYCSTGGAIATLKDINDIYNSLRIYKRSSPVTVSLLETTFSGYLYNMDIAPYNSAINAVSVTFTFIRDEER